ncbi:MAG TPA: ester cyclase [Candidatus Limnocylindrales bacterium]|jgi:steroid delta-isomerase-like uncharacterized protein
MSDELRSTVRRVYDAAFNARRLDALDELFAPDVIDRSVAKDAEQVGLDGFKQRIAGHHAGVSDLRMTIHDLVVEGNLVALRWSFQGTHDGTWLGRPATGRTFTLNGMNLERLDGNRIVEHWSYPDLLGLLRQLGLA